MFNLSGSEIVFMLVIGLVVLGPEKLPGALRKAGRIYGEFKRIASGAESDFRSAFAEPLREIQDTASGYKTMFTDAASGVTKAANKAVSEVKSPLGKVEPSSESNQPEVQPKIGDDIVDGM